jgi:hypothetical protein
MAGASIYRHRHGVGRIAKDGISGGLGKYLSSSPSLSALYLFILLVLVCHEYHQMHLFLGPRKKSGAMSH